VIGSAAVGALLQTQLATQLTESAQRNADELPPQFQQQFIEGFSNAGSKGPYWQRHPCMGYAMDGGDSEGPGPERSPRKSRRRGLENQAPELGECGLEIGLGKAYLRASQQLGTNKDSRQDRLSDFGVRL